MKEIDEIYLLVDGKFLLIDEEELHEYKLNKAKTFYSKDGNNHIVLIIDNYNEEGNHIEGEDYYLDSNGLLYDIFNKVCYNEEFSKKYLSLIKSKDITDQDWDNFFIDWDNNKEE